MKRSYIISLICLIILTGCFSKETVNQLNISINNTDSNINKEKTKENTTNKIKIKGLVLKYELISSVYEIYSINILKQDFRTEANYTRYGSHEHYLWLVDTYNNLNDEMKNYLTQIFSNKHAWYYMDILTKLDDSATVSEIISEVQKDPNLDYGTKLAFNSFMQSYYDNYFKTYLGSNVQKFQLYADNMSKQIESNNPDIISFMENISGIKFKEPYQPEFYYLLEPFSAYGFSYKNIKVSTLQSACIDYRNLLSAPFHEYSHEFFQTFVRKPEFVSLAENLKEDEKLKIMWLNSHKNSYDWVGWCEENIVNGFSKYLEYKYYGSVSIPKNYVYDEDFYLYLKQINFDGSKDSLKDASINFYKTKLNK